MKKYKLTFYEIKVSIRKKGARYALNRFNIMPGLTKGLALYLMERAGYSLYGETGDGTAKGVYTGERHEPGDGTAYDLIAAYRTSGNTLEIAEITWEYPLNVRSDRNAPLYYPEIRHYDMCIPAGKRFSDNIERLLKQIDYGAPQDPRKAEKLVEEARLSLIPKGYEQVTEGTVLPDDRYLQEDRRLTGMLGPGVMTWMRCDCSFSACRPGTGIEKDPRPVLRDRRLIVIRKK